MPTVFGGNRRRLELTGLEEHEELWDRLQEATAEARALAMANKKLDARVRMLARQLSEAGALTDDELVAELPKRMSRALEAAQGVATEIVSRAKKREAVISKRAEESARAIVQQAEAEASSIVMRATKEASAHIATAEAEALDLVGSANDRRTKILADLEDEVKILEQRMRRLRKDQSRLVRAYDIVERTVAESRAALGEVADRREPNGSEPSDHDERTAPAADRRAAVRPPGSRLKVYDWSPSASNAG